MELCLSGFNSDFREKGLNLMKRKIILLLFLLIPLILSATARASTVLQLEEQVEQLSERIKSREEALRLDYGSLFADKFSGRLLIVGFRQSCQGPDLNFATDSFGLPFLEEVPKVDEELVANYNFVLKDIMDLDYSHKNPNGFGVNISLRSIGSISQTKERLLLNRQSCDFTLGQFKLLAGDFKVDYTPFTIWGMKGSYDGLIGNSFDLVAQSRGWEKGAYPLKGMELTINSDENIVTGLYHNSASCDVFGFRSVFSLGKLISASVNVINIRNNLIEDDTIFGGDLLLPIGCNKIQLEFQRSQANQVQSQVQLTPLEDTAWQCRLWGPLLGFNSDLTVGATGVYYWSPLGEKDFSMGYNLSRSIYANPFLDNDFLAGPDFDFFIPGIAEPDRKYYKYKLEKRIGNISLGYNTTNFKRSKLNPEELLAGTWDFWIENGFFCEVLLGKRIGLPLSLTYRIQNQIFRIVNVVQGALEKSDYKKTLNRIGLNYQGANGSVIKTELILKSFQTIIPSKQILVINTLQYPLGSDAFANLEHSYVSSNGEEGFNFIGNGVRLNIGYSF